MATNTVGEFHYCHGYPCYHYSHGYWANQYPQPAVMGWQCPGCKTYYSPATQSCTCESIKVTWTTTDSSNVG